ncbi:MAG: hypothetical protein JWL97_4185 [Gemmatimonadales bacterium]|nr:hypothetical protein [Gemmatimonadales bacterium]
MVLIGGILNWHDSAGREPLGKKTSARPPQPRQSDNARARIVGTILGPIMCVLGVVLLIPITQDLRQAAGLTGTSVRFTVTNCRVFSKGYSCTGTISPDLNITDPVIGNVGDTAPASGTVVPGVRCEQSGHCFRTGAQQVAGAVFELSMAAGLASTGFLLLILLGPLQHSLSRHPTLARRLIKALAALIAAILALIILSAILTLVT